MTQEATSEELLRELENKPTETTQELREKRSLAEEYDSITATITAGGLLYRPLIIEHTDSGTEERQPALNWVSYQLTEGKYNVQTDSNDLVDGHDEDTVEVNPLKVEELLLSYYLSDEFLEEYTNKPTVYEVERYIVPTIALLLEPKGDFADHYDGDHLLAYISMPFHRGNAQTIFNALENNEEITISEEDDKLANIQFLNENTTLATLHSYPEQRFPFEVPAIKQHYEQSQNQNFIWEFLVESEHENWLKIPTTKPLTKSEAGQYELHLEGFKTPFLLDDPLTWNENHPTIQLIENYGGGDPEQIDYVYARPTYPLFDTPEHIIEHHNKQNPWEITTTVPTEKSEDNPPMSLLESLATIVWAMAILLFFFIFLGLLGMAMTMV